MVVPANPVMTFDAGALLSDERLINGPLEVYWNQDGWIKPTRPMPEGEWPKLNWWHRLIGWRVWRLDIRLGPPPMVDLQEFGLEISRRLDVPWIGSPGPDDHGVWMPGATLAPTAVNALASAGRGLERLAGLEIAQAQIRAERVDP